jgi:hypothetical protein
LLKGNPRRQIVDPQTPLGNCDLAEPSLEARRHHQGRV